jgi:lipopolysaccharide biosynthesis protein
VFYHDLWDDLAQHIANLRPLPFDLYVNLVEGDEDNERLVGAIRRRFPGAHAQVTENRGRDIGGFLRLVAAVLKSNRNYDSLILLHSKKSIRNEPGYGDHWRASLMASLLGRPERAAEIARAFMMDPYLGMVAAQEFIWSAANVGDLAYAKNKPLIDEYCERLGVEMRSTEFVAGTMFWVRAAPFLSVFTTSDPLSLAAELPTGDPNDETTPQRPHALDRVFSYIVTGQGYEIRGLPSVVERRVPA